MPKPPKYENKIITGDCLKVLPTLPDGCADLVFADPPFNIGYDYDGEYEDSRDKDEYEIWCGKWMRECYRILKPNGSFFLAIGDKYAAELKTMATKEFKEEGNPFHLRNWIVWHYRFGQNTRNKFALAHTHVFYFVKNPKDFTFNADVIRVMSDRQKYYADKRAFNTLGKLPDDVWDEFPRVCGTFGEREEFPCQMPEAFLARIVRACSNTGNLVVDPFAGSGTTPAVAKKLRRRYLGIEVSKRFAPRIRRRLKAIKDDDPDDNSGSRKVLGEGTGTWPQYHLEVLRTLYVETGVPADRLNENLYLRDLFCLQFHKRIYSEGEYSHENILHILGNLRRAGKLGRVRVQEKARTYKQEHPEQTSSLF